MAKKILPERYLLYRKHILILFAIILMLVLGMILTIIFLKDVDAKIYLIGAELMFILIFGNALYSFLSGEYHRIMNASKRENCYLSKEEYEKFVKQSKANDKFAK